MSIHGRNTRRARARVAKKDDTREKILMLLALLLGGSIITAALGNLLLMSP